MVVDTERSCILIDALKVKKLFGDSSTTFYRNVKEIEEQVKNGRYNRYSVIRSAKRTRVSLPVYWDYSTYRDQLLDSTLAKYVPRFDPKLIADLNPPLVVHEVIS